MLRNESKFIVDFKNSRNSRNLNEYIISENNRIVDFDARKYKPTNANISKIMDVNFYNVYNGYILQQNNKPITIIEKDKNYDDRGYRKIMKNFREAEQNDELSQLKNNLDHLLYKKKGRRIPREVNHKTIKPSDLYNLYLGSDEYDSSNNPEPNFRWKGRNELHTDIGGREYHQRKSFYDKIEKKNNENAKTIKFYQEP